MIEARTTRFRPVLAAPLVFLLAVACGGGGSQSPVGLSEAIRLATLRFDAEDFPDVPFAPVGWTEATHSKAALPDYDEAFPAGRVVSLDLRIRPAVWEAMLREMVQLFGELGGAGVAEPAAVENPTYQPCTVYCNGLTWWTVGVRFKGASTLNAAWTDGSLKLPLKLDFDEFEDDYPEIDDQRFYGFKKLSLSNGTHDPTYLRDKVAGDLFRSQGHPSPAKAFYRVTLDVGHGPVLLGLYTASEVADDKAFLENRFGNDDGNVYKPRHSPGGQWHEGSMVDEGSFPKKSNEDEADWSDVTSAIEALHAPRADAAAWRAGIEARFDAHGFMRWLAVNTTIRNWDAYGKWAHNCYLYGDEDQGHRLRWIAWDLDLSFSDMAYALSYDMSTVTDEWPLIRFLFDDPVYRVAYDDAIRAFLDSEFDVDAIDARLQAEAALVEPHVLEEHPALGFSSFVAFADGLAELRSRAADRYAAGRAYSSD